MEAIKELTEISRELIEILDDFAERLDEMNIYFDGFEKITKGTSVDYISLSQFAKKYGFITANTLSRYCVSDLKYDVDCIKKDGKWFVHEESTLRFLRDITLYKNRIKIFNEKIDSLNKI